MAEAPEVIETSAVVLAGEGLTVRHGTTTVLDAVDIAVARGDVVGVVGPNGSGKSTLLRALYGAQQTTSGRVILDGTPLEGWPRRTIAQRLAVVAQDPPTDLPLTVDELVLLGRLPHRRGLGGWTDEDRAIAARAIADCGIAELRGRRAWTLSGGERQRVLIARTLAQRAATVLWDEPTNHLDLRHAHDGLSLLARHGLSGVVVLHDLNLAARYCDRLLVLQAGRVVADGPPAVVLTPALVEDVWRIGADVVEHRGRTQLLFEPGLEDQLTPLPELPVRPPARRG